MPLKAHWIEEATEVDIDALIPSLSPADLG